MNSLRQIFAELDTYSDFVVERLRLINSIRNDKRLTDKMNFIIIE